MTLELDVKVVGNASPGFKGTFMQPPEGPEVEITAVWLGEGEDRIDVVAALSASDMEIIAEAFLEDFGAIEPDMPYDTIEERDMDRL
tara:strand:+ start:875 stop:1135 length:261 start_codon:yes stop_codon:yes gene_type:complete